MHAPGIIQVQNYFMPEPLSKTAGRAELLSREQIASYPVSKNGGFMKSPVDLRTQRLFAALSACLGVAVGISMVVAGFLDQRWRLLPIGLALTFSGIMGVEKFAARIERQ